MMTPRNVAREPPQKPVSEIPLKLPAAAIKKRDAALSFELYWWRITPARLVCAYRVLRDPINLLWLLAYLYAVSNFGYGAMKALAIRAQILDMGQVPLYTR